MTTKGDRMRTVQIGVQDMTCASCVARVERALKKVDGVSDAGVNLATEKASISYDPERTDLGTLLGSIETSGYETLSSETSFGVTGMTCANCSSRVERKLSKTEGVLEAGVNLATERATVRYPAGRGERARLAGRGRRDRLRHP